jgi:crotonobetainyl-CoA:carnitine CoA-transferase CaiB-like acyl-CoA transferase
MNAQTRLPQDELPLLAPSAGFQLLAGVRVLDLTSSIAGPYGTMLLADLGADVVKVERAGVGDDSRGWGPPFLEGHAVWYAAVNRNKRSVDLDLRSDEGRATLQSLAAEADVVVTSLRDRAMTHLGIAYDQVRGLRPDVVHCTITGYGLTGPKSELPGYDLIAEAFSSVMDLTGEPESGPQKIGTPAADLLAGMDAAFAIVAALYDRKQTGRGHQLDISLAESMTRFMTPKLASYLGSGDLQRRSGGRDSVIAIYQVFTTADEPIVLALGNDAIFARFCRAAGLNELEVDPAYATNAGRRAHREKLVGEIQQVLLGRPAHWWLELCRGADVPAGPINRVEDVVADEHLQSRSMLYRLPVDTGAVPQVNTGWFLDGEPNGYRLAPPRLGADREQVLAEWLGDHHRCTAHPADAQGAS